jgi:hypothetical protein
LHRHFYPLLLPDRGPSAFCRRSCSRHLINLTSLHYVTRLPCWPNGVIQSTSPHYVARLLCWPNTVILLGNTRVLHHTPNSMAHRRYKHFKPIRNNSPARRCTLRQKFGRRHQSCGLPLPSRVLHYETTRIIMMRLCLFVLCNEPQPPQHSLSPIGSWQQCSAERVQKIYTCANSIWRSCLIDTGM